MHKLAAWHWQYKAPAVAASAAAQGDQAEQDPQAAAEYGMPVQSVPAAEFDQLLKDVGLLAS